MVTHALPRRSACCQALTSCNRDLAVTCRIWNVIEAPPPLFLHHSDFLLSGLLFPRVDIGVDYEIVVTERSSALFGTSDAFELLEAPEESSVVKFRHVGGGGGAVGDMNTAMIVMASVCGMYARGRRFCARIFFAKRLYPEG